MSFLAGTGRPGSTPRPRLLPRESEFAKTLSNAAQSFRELAGRAIDATRKILNVEQAGNKDQGNLRAEFTSLLKSLKQAPLYLVGTCHIESLLKNNGLPKQIISTVEKIEKLIHNSPEELRVLLSSSKIVAQQVVLGAEKEQKRLEALKKLELQREKSTIEDSLRDLDDVLSERTTSPSSGSSSGIEYVEKEARAVLITGEQIFLAADLRAKGEGK